MMMTGIVDHDILRYFFNVQNLQVDIDDRAALEALLQGADLVLHCAGPFQRKETCLVLEAALHARRVAASLSFYYKPELGFSIEMGAVQKRIT